MSDEFSYVVRRRNYRPRRGVEVWGLLVQNGLAIPTTGRPTVEQWTAAAHEVAHAMILRLRPPFDVREIDRRLMALSRRTRIDHEIRAGIAPLNVVASLTGARIVRLATSKRMGAAVGAVALLLERHYGGDVRRAYELQAAISVDPTLREEMRRAIRGVIRRAERIARLHPPRRDVARVLEVNYPALKRGACP